MKIIIYDSNLLRGTAHCHLLHSIYPSWEIWHGKDGAVTAFYPDSNPAPTRYDLGFLHDNPMDELNWIRLPVKLSVFYNGGGCLKPSGIPRPVSAPGAALTASEVKAFCELVFAVPPTTLDEAIKIVWRDTGPMLTLRLLCDAFEMQTVGPGRKIYSATGGSGDRFIVDCPDPMKWFDLVGATAPSSDQDAPAIDAFGKFMGDAGAEAKILAKAIKGGGSIPDAVTKFRSRADVLREKGATL